MVKQNYNIVAVILAVVILPFLSLTAHAEEKKTSTNISEGDITELIAFVTRKKETRVQNISFDGYGNSAGDEKGKIYHSEDNYSMEVEIIDQRRQRVTVNYYIIMDRDKHFSYVTVAWKELEKDGEFHDQVIGDSDLDGSVNWAFSRIQNDKTGLPEQLYVSDRTRGGHPGLPDTGTGTSNQAYWQGEYKSIVSRLLRQLNEPATKRN